MVPEEKVRKLENIIRYNFVSKRFIHQALTAAGAENENYDGNRKLSQIGASLVDTILALIVYGTSASRGEGFSLYIYILVANDAFKGCTARLRTNFANKEHYAAVARQTGIVDCICYDDREGSRSSVVLRKALNAIIAAVFLDTWNPDLTIVVILRYKLSPESLRSRILMLRQYFYAWRYKKRSSTSTISLNACL